MLQRGHAFAFILALSLGCSKSDSKTVDTGEGRVTETDADTDTDTDIDVDTATDTGMDTGAPVPLATMGSWPILMRGGRPHNIGTTPIDPIRTVEAALATGQTRIAVPGHDGSPDTACPSTTELYEGARGAGHKWCALKEVVGAADGTDLEVFLLLNERHLSSSNRWLDTEDFYLSKSCEGSSSPRCHEHWDAQSRAHFRESFKAAAQEASRLSMEPGMGAMVGMAINDGDVYYCGPHQAGLHQREGCINQDDLEEIWQAGKTCEGCNPDFQFWAYASSQGGAPRTLPGSHILGQINSWSKLAEGVSVLVPDAALGGTEIVAGETPVWMPNETVALEIDIDVDAELISESIHLRFLYNDISDIDTFPEGLLFKFVEIEDGTGAVHEITRQDVTDNDWIERFDADISEHLTPGINTIRIGLRAAGSGLSGRSYLSKQLKRMQVWGLSIEAADAPLSTAEPRYICPDDCVGPEDDNYRGFFAAPPTMNSGAVSDGILLKLFTENHFYSETLYGHIVQAVRDAIPGDKTLEPVLTGRAPPDKFIDADVRMDEMRFLSRITDHIHIYDFPMPIFYQEEQLGIFTEPLWSHSADEPYALTSRWNRVTTWPNETACWLGWYQQYRVRDADSSAETLCLTIQENPFEEVVDDPTTAEVETYKHYFIMTIDQETEMMPTTLWTSLEEDYELDDDDARVWRKELSFDPTLDIRINLQNALGCGLGHKIFRIHAVASEEGCAPVPSGGGGFDLPVGAEFETWEFESGLTIPEHRELYCAIGQSMQELSGMVPWADEGGMAECAE